MTRQEVLTEMTSSIGSVFLGLTVGCARCHNHKFDPIAQKDYYRMQAVFVEVARVLRPGRYAVVIVRDAYQDGRYQFVGSDLDEMTVLTTWHSFPRVEIVPETVAC